MPAIQLTDRGSGVGASEESRVLARAAVAALGAPSILNTQPWRWRIGGATAELRADRARQVASIDPDGRLLVMSCGVALHHARTALSAAGYAVAVEYLPDPADPDLLATVRVHGMVGSAPDAVRMYRAMAVRHSDRRPFDGKPVEEAMLDHLRTVATAAGAHLHVLRPEDLTALTVASGRAATVELNDPNYHEDLKTWVGGRRGAGDGVPTPTAAPAAARPVPMRDFTASGPETTSIFDHLALGDTHARYAVIFTESDEQRDWLVAGETLSAVLLAATADGLASSMISDLVEVDSSRQTVRAQLGNLGHPMVVVRVGHPSESGTPAAAPRRTAHDVIDNL